MGCFFLQPNTLPPPEEVPLAECRLLSLPRARSPRLWSVLRKHQWRGKEGSHCPPDVPSLFLTVKAASGHCAAGRGRGGTGGGVVKDLFSVNKRPRESLLGVLSGVSGHSCRALRADP